MVEIILGNRGTRKTIRLMERAVQKAEVSNGNVVCIEKGDGLQFNLNTQIRLIDIDEYHIAGPDAYFGFLSGLLAGNYDITDILCDATFKIISGDTKDVAALENFIHRVEELSTKHDCTIVFSVSMDEADLPASLKHNVI